MLKTPKIKSQFVCQECHYQAPKWLGKCPECLCWNTFELTSTLNSEKTDLDAMRNEILPVTLGNFDPDHSEKLKSGLAEFDRVMGGGITLGSVTLLGGEPGVGKSTLILILAKALVRTNNKIKILLVSGEESLNQIGLRAKRLELESKNISILHETNFQKIEKCLKDFRPDFLFIDSIQTLVNQEINSPAGSISQVREVAHDLINFSKHKIITTFLIGHVTRDGNIAGPKLLEHMVDTVIYFEGDLNTSLRVLRTNKNRFGSTNEVGLFEMDEYGLNEIENSSEAFLSNSSLGSYGRCLTCVREGSRSIFVEIQALVVENKYGQSRRVAQGIDTNRLSMIVALLDKYLGVQLAYYDLYLNVVGGLKLKSTDTDLAILMAIFSSYLQKPIHIQDVFVGEVGLTGEIRKSRYLDSQINERKRYNYRKLFTGGPRAKKIVQEEKLIVYCDKCSDLKQYFQ